MDSNKKEHIIEGTVFAVDTSTLWLVEKENPDNVIPYQLMDYKGSHYEMDYNRVLKNVAFDDKPRPDIIHVTVPMFTQLDPERMAERFGIPVKEIAGKTDFDLVIGEKAFAERQAGILPTIPIRGDIFTVDFRLGEIRHDSGSRRPIKFDNMDLSDDANHRTFLYDATAKEQYWPDYKMLRLPDNIFMVTIPSEGHLDPYGLARLFGDDERVFMFHHPPVKDPKIILIPAKETWLAGQVAKNRDAYNKGQGNATDGKLRKQGF